MNSCERGRIARGSTSKRRGKVEALHRSPGSSSIDTVRALVIGLPLALAAPAVPVELEWNAPRQCPTRHEVLERVAAYVASEPEELTAVAAEAEVRRNDDGRFNLTLHMRVAGSTEQRQLTDDTCDGLAEVAALWIAIAVSPVIREVPRQEPTPPAPSSADTARDRSPGPELGRQPLRRRDAERPRIAVRFRGGGGLGAHPLSADFSASLAAAWPVLRLEVLGRYATPRRLALPEGDELGVQVSMWSVGGGLCASAQLRPRLQMPLCAAAEIGQVLGRPFGLVNERRAQPLWVGATASANLRGVLSARVALWLSPELVVAITRPTIRVGGLPYPAFQASPVGGRLMAGVEVILW